MCAASHGTGLFPLVALRIFLLYQQPVGLSVSLKHARGKVVVGYPVGGSVTLAFHASMLKLLGYEMGKGDKRLLAKITHSQGLYVADNRTMLAQRFLSTDADWLLQIDTDIEFPPTLIEDLVRHAGTERKVLVASVPLGAYPSCAFMRTDVPGVWSPVWPVPMTPILCDGIATAVALIHRDVFEAIAERGGQCWFHHVYLPQSKAGTPPRDFKFLSQGEDLAFSVRAADAGFKQWAVHIPGIKHHKTRGLSHDDEQLPMGAGSDGGVGELVDEGAVHEMA